MQLFCKDATFMELARVRTPKSVRNFAALPFELHSLMFLSFGQGFAPCMMLILHHAPPRVELGGSQTRTVFSQHPSTVYCVSTYSTTEGQRQQESNLSQWSQSPLHYRYAMPLLNFNYVFRQGVSKFSRRRHHQRQHPCLHSQESSGNQ